MNREKPKELEPFGTGEDEWDYVTINLRLYEEDLDILIKAMEGDLPYDVDRFMISNLLCKLRGLKLREWIRTDKKILDD